tara:strand:+ start:160 stop:501 length:342 start_codon:yes stop_codon:yes gene_type:complete
VKLILENWRQYEQQVLLMEGFEQALEEGKIQDWISNNLEKIKPLIATLKQKVAEGVEPFIVAVDKWKAGEKLSEEEKKAFIKAAASAGLLLIPGGTLLLLMKNLVLSRIWGMT